MTDESGSVQVIPGYYYNNAGVKTPLPSSFLTTIFTRLDQADNYQGETVLGSTFETGLIFSIYFDTRVVSNGRYRLEIEHVSVTPPADFDDALAFRTVNVQNSSGPPPGSSKDTEAPTCVIKEPRHNQIFTTPEIHVKGFILDNTPDDASEVFRARISTNLVGLPAYLSTEPVPGLRHRVAFEGNYPTGLLNGRYKLKLICRDEAKNRAEDDVWFKIKARNNSNGRAAKKKQKCKKKKNQYKKNKKKCRKKRR